MTEKRKTGRKPRVEDVTNVGVAIDSQLWARVVGTAEALGISRRRIIERALRGYFDNKEVRVLESIRDTVNEYFER